VFLEFEPYNKQIYKLRIKGKCNSLTRMHLQKIKEKDKERYYEDLQSVVDKVPKSDIVIIPDDINEKLGKEHNKYVGT